jgi:hypothetical protein
MKHPSNRAIGWNVLNRAVSSCNGISFLEPRFGRSEMSNV